MIEKLRKLIYFRHDVTCSQTYGDGLPYSFHLKCVEAQGQKFMHLIEDKFIENTGNGFSRAVPYTRAVEVALFAHDAIEDSRLTYNDLRELFAEYLENYAAGEFVADIVYCLTDEKGKNRAERKNEKYYKELRENKLAVFVKLADLSANTLYSKLTGSSMYQKYKKEFPNFKLQLFTEEYREFFDYLENL